MNDLTRTITDDFCESFTEEKDFQGFTAGLVADGLLPDGVNPKDERVRDIIRRCQEARRLSA